MAGKKGAKKTIGRARKASGPKYIMRLYYVEKENGAFVPKFERILLSEEGDQN